MQETDEQLEARLKREQAEREVLKQQLHQAPMLYEWAMTVPRPYETTTAIWIIVAGFTVGLFVIWDSGEWIFAGIFFLLACLLAGMAKFWGGSR